MRLDPIINFNRNKVKFGITKDVKITGLSLNKFWDKDSLLTKMML